MTRAGTARLFAALALPPAVTERLSAWARGAGARERSGMRVLAGSSMHLTLCFLGERPLEELESLGAALAETCARFPGFEVELGAPLLLPPRKPRALAVEAHDRSATLTSFQAALVTQLWQAIGEPPPPGRYRAHVTAARLRAHEPAMLPAEPSPALSFPVTGAAMFRSRLEPEGARYELLAGASFADV